MARHLDHPSPARESASASGTRITSIAGESEEWTCFLSHLYTRLAHFKIYWKDTSRSLSPSVSASANVRVSYSGPNFGDIVLRSMDQTQGSGQRVREQPGIRQVRVFVLSRKSGINNPAGPLYSEPWAVYRDPYWAIWARVQTAKPPFKQPQERRHFSCLQILLRTSSHLDGFMLDAPCLSH
jgi:hypothetical protein